MHKTLNEIWIERKKPLKILDLGAGPGRYWQEGILKNFLIYSNSTVELLDANTEFDSQTYGAESGVIRRYGVIPEALNFLAENAYDYVIAIDLIEHLPKEKGYLMLYEMDRISNYAQTIVTPNGFAWQPPSLNNPYNSHVSGWKPKELRKLGFRKIRGHIGSKINFGPYGLPKRPTKNWFFLEMLAIDAIVTYPFASTSFSFIATKYEKRPRIVNHI